MKQIEVTEEMREAVEGVYIIICLYTNGSDVRLCKTEDELKKEIFEIENYERGFDELFDRTYCVLHNNRIVEAYQT